MSALLKELHGKIYADWAKIVTDMGEYHCFCWVHLHIFFAVQLHFLARNKTSLLSVQFQFYLPTAAAPYTTSTSQGGWPKAIPGTRKQLLFSYPLTHCIQWNLGNQDFQPPTFGQIEVLCVQIYLLFIGPNAMCPLIIEVPLVH